MPAAALRRLDRTAALARSAVSNITAQVVYNLDSRNRCSRTGETIGDENEPLGPEETN